MTESFRLRASSIILSLMLTCALSNGSPLFAAAAYPTNPARHDDNRALASKSLSARIALFEKNDAPLAARLAQRDTHRNSRDIDAWFIAMEAATVTGDNATELQSALTLCQRNHDEDPRVIIAGQRLEHLGTNSEIFRAKRAAVEALAAGNSACSSPAIEALYEASLSGMPDTDIRSLGEHAGWIMKWAISRTGNAAAKWSPEHFEFASGSIHLPDYLPSASAYAADATYIARNAGRFELSGDLGGVRVQIDEHEVVPGVNDLTAGEHRVHLSFRASDATPRVRIVPATSNEASTQARVKLSEREAEYIRATLALASGDREGALTILHDSELADTAAGQHLLADVAPHTMEFGVVLQGTKSCVPDSVSCARWLAANDRHAEAIAKLNQIVREWPLNREAHRMLISELQRAGNSAAADRAAAEFLAIAPNARNFRRMAQSAELAQDDVNGVPFYQRYRRPAPAAVAVTQEPATPTVILLQDKVAIARRDGSVSLYMHRVVQVLTSAGGLGYRPLAIPDGAEVLTARVVNREASSDQETQTASLQPGDEIEEEFVVNYTGDGGMISHPEAFQYVFNDFDSPLLDARFVVLSPAGETPAYVIASGNVPSSDVESYGGLRAQIWQRKAASAETGVSDAAIVRVVENENGWSVPPSVERRRILETIHPGPRPREA